MFGFKPLIKGKYDGINIGLTPTPSSSELPKQQQQQHSTTTTTAIATQIIGQQDIIEFVDNALASPLTINVLFNGSPGTGKTLHLQRLREKLLTAFYYDFSNTSGAGFIYSLIRKSQEEDRKGKEKEMTLLLDG
jgi:MoxR-like ATPase